MTWDDFTDRFADKPACYVIRDKYNRKILDDGRRIRVFDTKRDAAVFLTANGKKLSEFEIMERVRKV